MAAHGRIVIQLHLSVDLHIFPTCLDIGKKLVDGERKVHALFEQNLESCLAAFQMRLVDILALGLFAHMPYLERENRQSVERPRGRFGIDGRVLADFYIFITFTHPGVDILHHIGAHLIRPVYASLKLKSLFRIDLRISDYILKMPLNGVNPVFGIKYRLERSRTIRVIDLGVYIVFLVIVRHTAVKNLVGYCRYTVHSRF